MRLHLLLFCALSFATGAESEEILIPRVSTTLDLQGQAVKIAAWGVVSGAPSGPIKVSLTADFGEVQQNITALLAAQMNRSERCGERLSLQQASIAPAEPSAILTANVHFEKYTCIKALGKEVVKRLVGGNGAVVVKLTPSFGADGVSMTSEVLKIDADGSLGELLRSGSLGDSIKQKIAASVQSAVRKGFDSKRALPPAVESLVTLRDIRFASSPEGRLWITAAGELHLSDAQFQSLKQQLRPR